MLSHTTIAQTDNLSPRTLRRRFSRISLPSHSPQCNQSGDNRSAHCILLDATCIRKNQCVVLIARTPDHIIDWEFAPYECAEVWERLICRIPSPDYVVCDGQKGLLHAVSTYWPNTQVQRCMTHIIRQGITWVSMNPKLPAGHDILRLLFELKHIRTDEERDRYISRVNTIYDYWGEFLDERTYWQDERGKRRWQYTHKNTRKAFRLLRGNLPHLFRYVTDTRLPRTTNYLEGGVNSPLSEIVRRHRGLSMRNLVEMVSIFLSQKPTQNGH